MCLYGIGRGGRACRCRFCRRLRGGPDADAGGDERAVSLAQHGHPWFRQFDGRNVDSTVGLFCGIHAEPVKREQLLGASRERDEIVIETFPDPADRVKSLTDRDIAVQRLDHTFRLIHDIDAALAKLQNRTYGNCERCGQRISSKRLDALPSARLCFACQSNTEAVERAVATHFPRAA